MNRNAIPNTPSPRIAKFLSHPSGRAARQFEKKLRGKSIQELSIEIDGDKVKFKSARKVGSGKDAQFELLKAGKLPARKVGGVIIGERHIRSKPDFKGATRMAEQAGMRMLKTEIEKIFR